VATPYRFLRLRQCLSLVLVLAAASHTACGGGSSPQPTPTPSPTPQPSPQPAEWTINGQIVEYGTGRGVSGGEMTADITGTVSVEGNGTFKISSTATPAIFHVRIDAPGFVTRETYVRGAAGARTNLVISVIRNAAPFSLDFYRELVRNSAEGDVLEPLTRWTARPNIYLRTVDQNGKAIEPEVLDSVTQSLRKGVVDWSSGTLSVATFEKGSATRERTNGWIVVNILRDRNSPYCGQSYVGAPDGQIELWDDRCSCGSKKIGGSLVSHEVGHAMGFWHVTDKKAIMAPVGDNCPTGILTDDEKYHAKLAYDRTPGNVDQDVDPEAASLSMSRGRLVSN
jgi:hypothetical protein